MQYNRGIAMAAVAAAGMLALSACGDDTVAQAPVQPPASQPASTGTDTGAGIPGAMSLLSGTAKSNNAAPGTGDWAGANGNQTAAVSEVAQKWVQLTAGRAGDLDPVVVNGAGSTLYRFDKDTPKPSVSNCNGDCATTWPPVTVAPGGKIFIAGVKKSAVGVVKRNDGQLQVTIKGWPVYRFSKDAQRGDTKGQGVGGTWFGVRPDGGKAGQPDGQQQDGQQQGGQQPGQPNGQQTGQQGGQETGQQGGQTQPAPDSGDPQAAPATSAVLFDDADFSDSGASQGEAGQGCQNVARPNVTSSLAATGRLKLWSGKDCTGTSLVVDGDVADLAQLNFDDKVTSVFFG